MDASVSCFLPGGRRVLRTYGVTPREKLQVPGDRDSRCFSCVRKSFSGSMEDPKMGSGSAGTFHPV